MVAGSQDQGSTLPPVARALAASWANSTLRNYNRGIATFARWCDDKGIPEACRLPACEDLLCEFAADSGGVRSGSSARNLLAGVRALHLYLGLPYAGGIRLLQVLRGVENLRPAESRRAARAPVTVELLCALARSLSPGSGFDAACFAAATAAFWCQARLGEFLSDSASVHDPAKFPSRCNLGPPATAKGSRSLHLPWTKTTRTAGASIVICRQVGPADPIAAMEYHLALNDMPPYFPLFAYTANGSIIALTKKRFLDRCNSVWGALLSHELSGHCFRIGGTTELLLRGISPHVVKALGRWSSDAFLRYWRSTDALAHLHLEDSSEPSSSSSALPSLAA